MSILLERSQRGAQRVTPWRAFYVHKTKRGDAAMKPVVGVVPLYDEEKNSIWMLPGYMDAVVAAGGLPVILPMHTTRADLRQFANTCQGFLFTGGQDVWPGLYGEEPVPLCGKPCSVRDVMERELLQLALEKNRAVMGICRGLQFINVALGGSLYQDLATQFYKNSDVNHQQPKPYNLPQHPVQVVEGTPLHTLLQKEVIQVNSCHHQGVRGLADRLQAMAYAPGMLVEAAYMPGQRYVRAYQWHPESMYTADAAQASLFTDFIQAC